MKRDTFATKSEQAQAIENFHLTKQMEKLRHQWADFKSQFYQSDYYRSYLDSKTTLQRQVSTPLSTAYKNTYNQLPPQVTRMKFNMLKKFPYSQRFVFLNILALTSAVLTLRGVSRFNAWNLGVKSLRNTALTYVFGGLVFAPEIYNPVLMRWSQIGNQLKLQGKK